MYGWSEGAAFHNERSSSLNYCPEEMQLILHHTDESRFISSYTERRLGVSGKAGVSTAATEAFVCSFLLEQKLWFCVFGKNSAAGNTGQKWPSVEATEVPCRVSLVSEQMGRQGGFSKHILMPEAWDFPSALVASTWTPLEERMLCVFLWLCSFCLSLFVSAEVFSSYCSWLSFSPIVRF